VDFVFGSKLELQIAPRTFKAAFSLFQSILRAEPRPQSTRSQAESTSIMSHAPLCNSFSFYCATRAAKNSRSSTTAYLKGVSALGSFSTVGEFWSIYSHLKRPEALPVNSSLFLFKSFIAPAWEAPENARGGRYSLQLSKVRGERQTDLIFERAVLAFIGGLLPEVNGLQVSTRSPTADALTIWVGEAHTEDMIPDLLRQIGLGDAPAVAAAFIESRKPGLEVA
jgi:translation initiation factor 4E